MARIKQDTSPDIIFTYLEDANYLSLRGYRSEATIRALFWKSIITHVGISPATLTQDLLTKKFLHTFINVSASIESLDTYFDGMSRQFWELNKSEIDDFFLDQNASYDKTLTEVIGLTEKLSMAYKDANNIPFNLDGIHSEGKRSGESISEIILSNYPNELIVSKDSETRVLLKDAIPDDQIKRIHDKMMDATLAHLTSLIYHKYFLPFETLPHLPFLKIK